MTGRGRQIGRRLCAVLAAGSAALHAVMAFDAANVAVIALTLAMAAVCLLCAYELWSASTKRVWGLVLAMNVAMIALHLPVPSHRHANAVDATAGHTSTIMLLAAVTAVLEAMIATVVLYRVSRAEAQALIPERGAVG